MTALGVSSLDDIEEDALDNYTGHSSNIDSSTWGVESATMSSKVKEWRVSTMEPLPLPELLNGLEGKWVALQEGKVIAAADTSDALFKQLRSKRIRNAAVLRVPTEGDHGTELVGLG